MVEVFHNDLDVADTVQNKNKIVPPTIVTPPTAPKPPIVIKQEELKLPDLDAAYDATNPDESLKGKPLPRKRLDNGREKAGNYERDDNAVYYGGNIVQRKDKEGRFHNADPKGFKVLNQVYGKDNEHVYYLRKEMPGADAKSFRLADNGLNGKDDKHTYTLNNILE